MKALNFLAGMLLASSTAFAQTEKSKLDLTDSLKSEALDEAALMYPRLRQFAITHEEQGVSNIRSSTKEKEVYEGKFRVARTVINMNTPIINRSKNSLILGLGVMHQFYSLSETKSFDPQQPIPEDKTYIPMISSSLTYLHRDSLFNRPVTFIGNFGGIFNPEFSMHQFTFSGIATIQLINKANTRLTGGIVAMLDPASPVPAFLMLNYFHKFQSIDLDLMVDLPFRLAFRKKTSKNTSLSLFNELAGSNSFFKFGQNSYKFPQNLTFSTLEIKSGLLAEYRVTKKAVVSLSAGVNSTVKSRILENNAKSSNYLISNKNSLVPFAQIGISLLPFWKGLNL